MIDLEVLVELVETVAAAPLVGALLLMSAPVVDLIGTVFAWLVVAVAMPVLWLTAIRLRLLRRERPDIKVLRQQAWYAVTLAFVITVFGLVFINNDMPIPFLDVPATRVLTRGALLFLVPPALYWLWLYRGAE